ncbi:MAG: SufD family Fe-S cluster assembly protein [Dehalococcoidia bacterium]|nr:SufD family Fe-S cluster assembly protein [Dehalococcoidia bacterium]
MTALVEQRMDFRTASAAVGTSWKDSPAQAALRARGAKAASEMEWPDSRAERPWKYFEATSFGLTPETPLADIGVAISGAPAGVAVRFSEATGDAAGVLAKHLGTVVLPEADRLTALHYAYLRDGVLINVPANAELSEPIHLTRTVSGPGVSTPHTLIVTGANSRVTVVQEYVSSDEPIVALLAAEVIPGPGAEVQYYCVHRWGRKTKAFAYQRFLGRERDAAFRNLHMVLGGEAVKGHLESTLEARGTSSELLGVAYGTGNTQADFYTFQDHIGPDTRSDLEYKAALKDNSQAIYYGVTKVGLGAKNADANQENRNLLLSETARANSDPVLEILTSDIVRASHGATAGPVDQEQLFYMQARGIARPEAESMLVTAFLEDVLSRVPNLELREELVAKLEGAFDR